MRQYTPQQVGEIVEGIGLKFINGGGDIPGPASIAYLLMDEIGRVQKGAVEDEAVSLMLAAAALLTAYATEKMAEDEARVDLLRRAANSKYLRFSYVDDSGAPLANPHLST